MGLGFGRLQNIRGKDFEPWKWGTGEDAITLLDVVKNEYMNQYK